MGNARRTGGRNLFGRKITLFSLFGFKVSVDLSWIIIAVLVTWSLAEGVFPRYLQGLSVGTYWWMGAVGAAGLFASIVVHELFHSLVARRFGLPMKGITLFLFGGVAEMEDEPPSAKSEFFMSIAGPITSIVVGLIFLSAYWLGNTAGWSKPAIGIVFYLGAINLILAVFNLVPAFPLDGGRVLRSALWYWKGSLRWATRVASQIGGAFGIILIVLGVIYFIRGAFLGGVWWALIGLFIRRASQMSYQRVLIRKALEGETVERFMKRDPVTVSPDISINDLVEDYVYKHHFKMYPVTKDGDLLGCITTKEIKDIPRDKWKETRVSDVAQGCLPENSIRPDTDATKALSLMGMSGRTRLMVTDGTHLLGLITLKDLLRFLTVKMDLAGDEVADRIAGR
jgi:Zn-dependent protease/predicted transcriptional regulator